MKALVVCPGDLGRREPVQWCASGYADLTDRGYTTWTCPHGHTNVFYFQGLKFSILFEMGAMALLDGYHREAVTSFASSLERFLEFFIKVAARHFHIDDKHFKEAWKHVANQSERQLGAFHFLYLLLKGEGCGELAKMDVAFRNKIVHKGQIPERDEAVSFGDWVLQFMYARTAELLAIAPEQFHETAHNQAFEIVEEAGKIGHVVNASHAWTICHTRMDNVLNRPSLSEALVEVAKRKQAFAP